MKIVDWDNVKELQHSTLGALFNSYSRMWCSAFPVACCGDNALFILDQASQP